MADSQNTNYWQAFEPWKAFVGERPPGRDREFRYLELLSDLAAAGLSLVLRRNRGSPPPPFGDAEGQAVPRSVGWGHKVVDRNVWDRGPVWVHGIDLWQREWAEPGWGMSPPEPEEALRIDLPRLKSKETFRDLKGLWGWERPRNQSWEPMEKRVALRWQVWAVGQIDQGAAEGLSLWGAAGGGGGSERTVAEGETSVRF